MPKERQPSLIELRDRLLALESAAAAAMGRTYSRRQIARLLAPGDQRLQRRWNNRIQRWMTDTPDQARPGDFDQLWELVAALATVAQISEDPEAWRRLHRASDPHPPVEATAARETAARETAARETERPAAVPLVDPHMRHQEDSLLPTAPRQRRRSPTLVAASVMAAVVALAVAVGLGRPFAQAERDRVPGQPAGRSPHAVGAGVTVSPAPEPVSWFRAGLTRAHPDVLTGAAQQLRCLSFAPDGSRLAAVGGDGAVYEWGPGDEESSASVGLAGGGLFGVAFTPDGNALVTAGEEGRIHVIDPATSATVRVFDLVPGESWWLAMSPDGTTVAEGTGHGSVRLWDFATGSVIRELRVGGHADPPGVGGVAFSPDSQLLASGGPDDVVRIWDVASGRLVRQLRGHTDRINKVTFSDDGTRLASTGDDARAIVWDTATWRATRRLVGHQGGVWGVDFSPDGTLLATSSMDDTARVWDLATGGATVLAAHQGNVWDVAFDPAGTVVATAQEEDRTVRLWPIPR